MFRPFAIFLTLAIVYLVTVDVSGADTWTSDQEQIVVTNNAYIQAILSADVASLMNFSGLWRRDSNGTWRIARDMWNIGDDVK